MEEIDAALRQALDRLVDGQAISVLGRAAGSLSQSYRAHHPTVGVTDPVRAWAYAVVRMPATVAVLRHVYGVAANYLSDYLSDRRPNRLLDLGAGTGGALWAAGSVWPDLPEIILFERLADFITVGQSLAESAGTALCSRRDWRQRSLPTTDPLPGADLVTLSYALNEIPVSSRRQMLSQAWQACSALFVLVEPGTPQGYDNIRWARQLLIAAGAQIVAPCPHHEPCPLIGKDWCHFSVRLSRGRVHRLAKGGSAAFEDEKFSYLIASREPVPQLPSRILTRPRWNKTGVALDLCQPDGKRVEAFIPRQDPRYKVARHSLWGDIWNGTHNEPV